MRNISKAAVMMAFGLVCLSFFGTPITAKAVGETGTFTLNGRTERGTLIDSGYIDKFNTIQYKIIERGSGKKHLEFTGTGDMPDFVHYSNDGIEDKWRDDNAKDITTVAFGEGITRIGAYTLYFVSWYAPEVIWLPEGLREIGQGALGFFKGSYLRIPSTVTRIESDLASYVLEQGRYLTLPVSLEHLEGSYYGDRTITYYPGTEAELEEKLKNFTNIANRYKLFESIRKSNGFGKTDPNYDNYMEYVPFKPDGSSPEGFTDVPDNAYYKDAVEWAKDKGITSGVDGGARFGVGQTLTRAMAVTFLHAYAGGGSSSSGTKFNDVPSGAWYGNHVSWAVVSGITKGVGQGRFNPEGTVSRAEAVTFLKALAKGNGGSASFKDVPKNSWFYDSVAWAVDKGITSGTGNGSFSPGTKCTREQFVMMMYKLSQAK